MRDANRLAYERELFAAAKRLGLRAQGDIEKSIIDHALTTVRGWMAAHGRPSDLSDLLQKIAVSFSIEIFEIHDDNDLEVLFRRIPPTREPALARLSAELDDSTDAVIMQRQNREPWEMPYLAVINCRGWHHSRRYFSKWHEVIHLLLDGRQLRFAFRRRTSKRKHPEEVLVDKIAGVLAFHPDLFEPVLASEIDAAGGLTFAVVEHVRAKIAPDASRESTLYACLRSCPEPVCFVKAQLGFKLAEQRQLDDLLSGLPDTSVPQPKLRIQTTSASPAALRSGIRFHENMQVPDASLVSVAYAEPGRRVEGEEDLDIWQTSSDGPIATGRIHVEAVRRGDEVWALLHLLPGARPTRRSTQSGRVKGTAPVGER